MQKIFISYKREDKEKVFDIVKDIKRNTGCDCWIDLNGIESGDQFENVIIKAINEVDIVVFMLSKNFIAPYRDAKTGKLDPSIDTFPKKEVKYAIHRNKRLIPLSIDGTTIYDSDWLTFNCANLDCIDYSDDSQRQKFFLNLRKWLGDSASDGSLTVNEPASQDEHVLVDTDNVERKNVKTRSTKLSFFSQFGKRQKFGCSVAIAVTMVLCVIVLPNFFINPVENDDTINNYDDMAPSYDDSGGDSYYCEPDTSEIQCPFCLGSGKCMNANISNSGQYCNGTGVCGKCDGCGILKDSLNKVCNYCNGSGLCVSCGGTGKCNSCNGSGYY